MNNLGKYSLIVFITVIGISAQILLKKGLSPFKSLGLSSFIQTILVIISHPIILLALACYAVGAIAYLFLLSKIELTSIYPICTSLIYAGITFFGWLLLNEPLSWPKASGIILIIAGILIIERFG